MSRRVLYSDARDGEHDHALRMIIEGDVSDSESRTIRLRKTLLKVINNELTPRQKEIIMLYYFKDMDCTQIAKLLSVSPQAVSAAMKRARLTIYRYMQYCID